MDAFAGLDALFANGVVDAFRHPQRHFFALSDEDAVVVIFDELFCRGHEPW